MSAYPRCSVKRLPVQLRRGITSHDDRTRPRLSPGERRSWSRAGGGSEHRPKETGEQCQLIPLCFFISFVVGVRTLGDSIGTVMQDTPDYLRRGAAARHRIVPLKIFSAACRPAASTPLSYTCRPHSQVWGFYRWQCCRA